MAKPLTEFVQATTRTLPRESGFVLCEYAAALANISGPHVRRRARALTLTMCSNLGLSVACALGISTQSWCALIGPLRRALWIANQLKRRRMFPRDIYADFRMETPKKPKIRAKRIPMTAADRAAVLTFISRYESRHRNGERGWSGDLRSTVNCRCRTRKPFTPK